MQAVEKKPIIPLPHPPDACPPGKQLVGPLPFAKLPVLQYPSAGEELFPRLRANGFWYFLIMTLLIKVFADPSIPKKHLLSMLW